MKLTPLRVLTIPLILTITACTSMRTTEQPSATTEDPSRAIAAIPTDGEMECRREKVMGSNLTQRVCTPKSSSAEDAQPKTQIAKVDENEDQIVCKKEKVMGSNLRKRVCYRKKDRDARNKNDQDDYREMSTRSVRPGASTLD